MPVNPIFEICGFEEPLIQPQCGRHYDLTLKEQTIVDLIYWVRNMKLGLQASIEKRFHPGPSGRRGQRGWWWPAPVESCDCLTQHTFDDNSKKMGYSVDPWAWWKHCKSLQHIVYLLKNRTSYVLEKTFSEESSKVPWLMLPWNPELAKRKGQHWLIDRYIEDNLSGKFIRHYKDKPKLNSRFDLLKES